MASRSQDATLKSQTKTFGCDTAAIRASCAAPNSSNKNTDLRFGHLGRLWIHGWGPMIQFGRWNKLRDAKPQPRVCKWDEEIKGAKQLYKLPMVIVQMSLTVLVGDRGALSAQLEGVHGEVGLRWKGRKLEASHVGDANFFPPSRPVACSRRCRGTVPCDRVLITAITQATILPALPRPVWCLSDISIFFPPKFNVLIYVHQCPPPHHFLLSDC